MSSRNGLILVSCLFLLCGNAIACNDDWDCDPSKYCTFKGGQCTTPLPIGHSCTHTLDSMRQCANGACDYLADICIPLSSTNCNAKTYYPCVNGMCCVETNNQTHAGWCENTKPNGQACNSAQECQSGFCFVGKCATNPIARIVNAVGLTLLTIILISIGVVGVMVAIGIAIWCCYCMARKRQPVTRINQPLLTTVYTTQPYTTQPYQQPNQQPYQQI